MTMSMKLKTTSTLFLHKITVYETAPPTYFCSKVKLTVSNKSLDAQRPCHKHLLMIESDLIAQRHM